MPAASRVSRTYSKTSRARYSRIWLANFGVVVAVLDLDGGDGVHGLGEHRPVAELEKLGGALRHLEPVGEVRGEALAAQRYDRRVGRAPREKVATSVVPPPMSTSAMPASRSASSRQASAEASGSSTTRETLTPQSSTARSRFWMLETAPLTTCARIVTLRAARPNGVLDALRAVEDVAAGDDVDDPLVLVQVQLPGLLLEFLQETLVHGEVPAAVEEGDLGVEG
jgi:hypothetical protein